jgi:hypothetical protein
VTNGVFCATSAEKNSSPVPSRSNTSHRHQRRGLAVGIGAERACAQVPLALLDVEADDAPAPIAGDQIGLPGCRPTALRVVAGMHLVLAGVGQQMPVGKPEPDTDQPALQLIGEETLQQQGAAAGFGHAVKPTPEGVDTRQLPATEHPPGLLAPRMLELLE